MGLDESRLTRRDWLAGAGRGLFATALAHLLATDAPAAAIDPLAARSPHFPASAEIGRAHV